MRVHSRKGEDMRDIILWMSDTHHRMSLITALLRQLILIDLVTAKFHPQPRLTLRNLRPVITIDLIPDHRLLLRLLDIPLLFHTTMNLLQFRLHLHNDWLPRLIINQRIHQ
jgi:hypothetical protein